MVILVVVNGIVVVPAAVMVGVGSSWLSKTAEERGAS